MPLDICLVHMPYASVHLPSLGLGLLHAILERDGFSVSTVYASILFADSIGLMNYNRILGEPPENGAPEWTFAHVVFPRHGNSSRVFLNALKGRKSYLLKHRKADEILGLAAGKAPLFIERLAEDILSRKPRIVACGSSLCQHVPSLALLKRINERAPEVITLMGGANCETVMGKATHEYFPWIDYVVSGDADELIGPLCRDILVHERAAPVNALPVGVFAPIHRDVGYPEAEGIGTEGIPRAITKKLRHQPAPNYDPFFETLKQCPAIESVTRPGVLVEASRGCWWATSGGCSFCGLNGCLAYYRVRPADHVLDELDSLSRRHKIRRFEFTDNALAPELFKTLIPELIGRGAPYELFFEVRAGLKRDQVEALRKSGVTWVQAGIESLHTEALRLMNKGTECRHNIQLLKWLRQYGIRCSWNLLHDFPDEDDAWFDEMASYFPLLTHLVPPAQLSRIRLSRFSAYETRRGQYNIDLIPAEPFRLIYPLEDHQLERLVYFFDDQRHLNAKRNPLLACILDRPGLDRMRAELVNWTKDQKTVPPASLIMTLNGDTLRIRDTRRVAVAREINLSGLERDLYLVCDDAPTEETLVNEFAQRGFGRREIEDAIVKLEDTKLLLRMDGRLIGLALRDPVTPLQAFDNFPGGGFRITAAAQETRKRRTNGTGDAPPPGLRVERPSHDHGA